MKNKPQPKPRTARNDGLFAGRDVAIVSILAVVIATVAIFYGVATKDYSLLQGLTVTLVGALCQYLGRVRK